jgi:hypothetical protein
LGKFGYLELLMSSRKNKAAMAQAEKQERTTIGLRKGNAATVSELELVMNLAWLFGWLGLGIAVVTAFASPPVIVFQARGFIIIRRA